MKDLDENGEDISKSAPAKITKKKDLAEVAKMLEEEKEEAKEEEKKPAKKTKKAE